MTYNFNLGRTLRGALIFAAMTPAAAMAGDRIGSLECHLSGNGPSILVENQAVDCVFASDRSGARSDHYIGKLTKIGADLGANGRGDLLWGVVAATSRPGRGALAGQYVGPEASAKLGVGAGAAALVGGSNSTFSLQPLNVEGGQGIGFSAGVESLTLAYVVDRPAPRMHYRRHHHHHEVRG